jgi:hypothetical protein
MHAQVLFQTKTGFDDTIVVVLNPTTPLLSTLNILGDFDLMFAFYEWAVVVTVVVVMAPCSSSARRLAWSAKRCRNVWF